jgi:VIT1/CCC1 family predicted Fe2+/Mn2+ transporter
VPFLVAASNGLSPLLLSLFIMLPLWTAGTVPLPLTPLDAAVVTAFAVVFLLGAYLGHVGRTSWWGSGLQALFIALATMGAIYLLDRALGG